MQHNVPLLRKTEKKTSRSSLVALLLLIGLGIIAFNFSRTGQDENSTVPVQGGGFRGFAVGVKSPRTPKTPKTGAGSEALMPGMEGLAIDASSSSQAGPSTELEDPPSPQAMPQGYSPVPQVDPDAVTSPRTGALCNDEVEGYEVKVGTCNLKESHKVFFAMTTRVGIPKALSLTARCKGSSCTAKDESSCCVKRRQCMAYNQDVREGCQPPTRVNPFEYAFCRTVPCTINDADICCVKVEASSAQVSPLTPQFHAEFYDGLFERIANDRSKSAKEQPSDDAKDIKPAITFGPGTIAWFDMSQRQRMPTGDTWAPLVDFMRFWRDDMGWPTTAWMKVMTKDGQNLFRQYITDLDGAHISWIKKAKEKVKSQF